MNNNKSKKNNKNNKNVNGFTLIELLIVVLIIGILAAIALPQYQLARDKAKYANYQTLSRKLSDAQKRQYLTSGEWPAKFDELDVDMPSGGIVKNFATYQQYMVYDGWFCFITTSKYGAYFPAAYCGNDKFYYWQTNDDSYGGRIHKLCVARTEDARAIRLCKAETGKSAGIPSYSMFDYKQGASPSNGTAFFYE